MYFATSRSAHAVERRGEPVVSRTEDVAVALVRGGSGEAIDIDPLCDRARNADQARAGDEATRPGSRGGTAETQHDRALALEAPSVNKPQANPRIISQAATRVASRHTCWVYRLMKAESTVS